MKFSIHSPFNETTLQQKQADWIEACEIKMTRSLQWDTIQLQRLQRNSMLWF